jgi:hypothetical protein
VSLHYPSKKRFAFGGLRRGKSIGQDKVMRLPFVKVGGIMGRWIRRD